MKISKQTQQQSQELTKQLIEKAWESESFKDQLLKSPIETISEFTKGELCVPEGKHILVEDQSDISFIYLNIPAEPNFDELELTDNELELVAGGLTPVTVIIVVGTVAGGFGTAALIDWIRND